jgi:hypothetical protein
MVVTFHALTAAGIAHIAATQVRTSGDGWFFRSDLRVLGIAIFLGVLSHGVLDGLKHGYPIRAIPDIICASLLAVCWCIFVHRRFSLLFASVFLASFAPDVVDLGPGMLRSITGISMLTVDVPHLFPWHWLDGSGSMYPMSSTAPERIRILDIGQNTTVSWTNHLIVVVFAASGILANPRVFRFLSPRNIGVAAPDCATEDVSRHGVTNPPPPHTARR